MRSRVLIFALLTLAAAMTAGFCVFGHSSEWLRGQNDFRQLYVGATLVGDRDLYSFHANAETQEKLRLPVDRSVTYSRPPFYAALLRPLTKLPYVVAYWSFQVVSLGCLGVFIWLFAPELPSALRVGMALPLTACLALGQDVFIVLLAAGTSIILARAKWDLLAGVVLAACAIKFHLFVFVPLVLMRHRRWRMICGAAGACGALIAISFLVNGSDWPGRYWSTLSNPTLHLSAAQMPNIHGLAVQFGFSWQIELTMMSVFAAVAALSIWRTPFETGFAVALVAGLFVTYHSYLFDHALLLIAVPQLARCVRWGSLVLAEFVGPLPYLFLGLPLVKLSVLLFFVSVLASVAVLPRWKTPGIDLEPDQRAPVSGGLSRVRQSTPGIDALQE